MGFSAFQKKWQLLIKKGHVKEATDLYWKSVHAQNEKRFNKQVASLNLDQYDWLIIPAGIVDRYYVLLINAIKPKKVFFISTHEFRNYFLNFILARTDLKRQDYIIHPVDYDNLDLSTIYKIIKENKQLFFQKKVLVDLTRGKRVLTAGAALMSAVENYDLAYIDEDWIDICKRGLPCSERLVPINNPFEVFGDLEDKFAKSLFNFHSYCVSSDVFQLLQDKVQDPRNYEIKQLIARAYDYWDAFNYISALKILEKALFKIEQYNLEEYKNPLLKNIKSLKKLIELKSKENIKNTLKNEKAIVYLLIDIYLSAQRRFVNNRYEDAVTRLYRACELISQHRLSKIGISTINPDYKQINISNKTYRQFTKTLFGIGRDLPHEIGLKDGHLILFLLKDELWKNSQIHDLKEFFGLVRNRDDSIIAHGFEIISPKSFKKFDITCKKFIEKICQIANVSFESIKDNNNLIKL
jgi:CRISPR-associated protein (TIGR02710 family)